MSEPQNGFWDGPDGAPVSNETYHGDYSAIGHTMLEDFRESSIEYRNVYVTRTSERKKPTAALRLGSAVHCMLFEPEKYDSDVLVFTETKTLESKAGAEFTLLNPGKIILTEDQAEHVVPMVKSVLAHPRIAQLMREEGHRERAVRALDPRTGLWLKCKPDFLTERFEGNLKTTRDPNPEAWVKDAANFGYHRAASFYRTVLNLAFGWTIKKVVYFVVKSSPDYECAAYSLDDEFLDIGERQNHRKLDELADCYATGEWRSLQHREIVELQAPRWARYED